MRYSVFPFLYALVPAYASYQEQFSLRKKTLRMIEYLKLTTFYFAVAYKNTLQKELAFFLWVI